MGRNEMGQLPTAIATSAEDGQAVLDDSDIHHPSALAILSQGLCKDPISLHTSSASARATAGRSKGDARLGFTSFRLVTWEASK